MFEVLENCTKTENHTTSVAHETTEMSHEIMTMDDRMTEMNDHMAKLEQERNNHSSQTLILAPRCADLGWTTNSTMDMIQNPPPAQRLEKL